MIDRFTPQLGSNISAQIDCTSGGSADQFIDADQCRYARQHLLHIHTVIISTRTEASRFFFTVNTNFLSLKKSLLLMLQNLAKLAKKKKKIRGNKNKATRQK